MTRLNIAPEFGIVLTLKDGIAAVSGLLNAFAGELVHDDLGNKGMALNLERSRVGVVMFDLKSLKAGARLHRTYKLATMTVGPDNLSSVVDSLGSKLSESTTLQDPAFKQYKTKKKKQAKKFENLLNGLKSFGKFIINLFKSFKFIGTPSKLVESKATGILLRQSVDESLYTGIVAVDSVIPVGKGQRELIIGDRQTGKTSLGFDAMLNQSSFTC